MFKNIKKKVVPVLISGIVLLSAMAVTASADNYDGNTYTKDLTQGYVVSGIKDGMNYYLKYGVRSVWSHTSVQVGLGPARGTAYTAFMKRGIFGADAGFTQNTSTTKLSNGYIDVTLDGDTKYANYVLHSGTSNVTYGWRFDMKYIK